MRTDEDIKTCIEESLWRYATPDPEKISVEVDGGLMLEETE